MTILIVCLLLFCAIHAEAQNPQDIVRQIIRDRSTTNYQSCDFFRCATYENTQLALNDVDPFNLNNSSQSQKKHSWIQKTAIRYGLNNKFVLPLMTEQRVEELRWRHKPQRTVHELLGINREGLNEIFDSGDIVNVLFAKKFGEFNICDDTINIAGRKIYSPLGKYAMQYYDYGVEITDDSVARVNFEPKVSPDVIITGEIIAIKDSVWRVKLAKASLPLNSVRKDVDELFIYQEFGMTPQNMWMIRKSEFLIELKASRFWGKLCYIKRRTYSHFSTDPIDKKLLRGKAEFKYNALSEYRTPQFWQTYDTDLSEKLQQEHEQDSLHGIASVQKEYGVVHHSSSYAQRRINEILEYVQDVRGVGLLAYPTKALVNNYIGIGNPEWFNIEPVTSLISFNDIDNLRLRLGGKTTANLNRHIFLGGYLAYGFRRNNVYYDLKGTYSFRKKNYSAEEFPRRNISIESRYDIGYLGERTAHGDHDDLFKSYHWDKKAQMMFFRMQNITLERDEMNGMGSRLSLKHEEDRATGGLVFHHMRDITSVTNGYTPERFFDSMDNGTIRTTELRLELLYCPQNNRYYSRKQLAPDNAELPSIGLAHTIGMKILGGEYTYHLTELKLVKQWFLGNLGIGKSMVKTGVLWDKVPYPLLLSPPANISYVGNDESFSLISTSEFINDKYLQLLISWETNGNVIGLIPIIKRLRWREYLAVRMLWGSLNDRNNPYLPENRNSGILMPLPENVNIMDSKKPYMEGVVGIHNIFHILNVDYIYRFTYRNLRKINMGGFRFTLHMDF